MYQNVLIENVKGLKAIYEKDFKKVAKAQLDLIEDISLHIVKINDTVTEMTNNRKEANLLKDVSIKATEYCEKVKPLFEAIRYHCDKLELLVDDELWPLIKYREILFTK